MEWWKSWTPFVCCLIVHQGGRAVNSFLDNPTFSRCVAKYLYWEIPLLIIKIVQECHTQVQNSQQWINNGIKGCFAIAFLWISLLGVGIFWPIHCDKWTAAAARPDSSQSPVCARVCARGEQGLWVLVSMGPGCVRVLLYATPTVGQATVGGAGQRGTRSAAPGQAAKGGRIPSSRGCYAPAAVGTKRLGEATAGAAHSWECRKRSDCSCRAVGDTCQTL